MDIPKESQSKTFSAIHDEALRLLELLREPEHRDRDLREGLELILSLARYQYDIRTEKEIARASGDE
jgi:hypothetical protein